MSLANDKGTPEICEGKNALEVHLISIAYSITENPSIPLNISIQNLAQYKLALSKRKGYQKNNALSFLPQAKFRTQKILFWPRPRIPAPWNAMNPSLTLLEVVSLPSLCKNNAFIHRFQREKCNSPLLHALFVKPWQILCRQRSLIIKTQNWIRLHRQASR